MSTPMQDDGWGQNDGMMIARANRQYSFFPIALIKNKTENRQVVCLRCVPHSEWGHLNAP